MQLNYVIKSVCLFSANSNIVTRSGRPDRQRLWGRSKASHWVNRWQRSAIQHGILKALVLCWRQASATARKKVTEDAQTRGQTVSPRGCVERSNHESANVCAAKLRRHAENSKAQNHFAVQWLGSVECETGSWNIHQPKVSRVHMQPHRKPWDCPHCRFGII